MVNKRLSKEEILHLANLAKLELTEEEISRFQDQLGETIDYVKNLDELDTKDVLPTNSVVDLENAGFDDGGENDKELTQKEALSNTKKHKKGMFVVSRIL